jgi:hypothetical protein
MIDGDAFCQRLLVLTGNHHAKIPDMQASPATNHQKSSIGDHVNISKLFNAICQT